MHTMEVTQHSGAHTMGSYVIDCHEKDRASSRAARKAFKGVQSSTASGDATRILLAKKHRENHRVGGRNALSLLSAFSQAVRAFSCSIPTRFTRDATRLNAARTVRSRSAAVPMAMMTSNPSNPLLGYK